jgi:phosphohistidine phosphatase
MRRRAERRSRSTRCGCRPRRCGPCGQMWRRCLLGAQQCRLQTGLVCGHTGLMRRRLIALRHAKSDWSGGVADHDRPLAGRGRREAALAGRWLRENAADIDLVVCSSATRARQTWKLVAKQLDNVPPARVDDRLYAASVRGLLAVVRKLPDSACAVLLIGHNPGLEELVADLGGVGWPMKTSSIAVLSSRSEWAEVGARWAKLEVSLTPRS